MSDGQVRYDKAGAVGTVTFDRPATRNAMTPAMYASLDAICDAVAADAELRCIVFRGAGGKSFIAGSDISHFLKFEDGADGVAYERTMSAHLAKISAIPIPTIAVIEGFAVGGGLNIAACCDLRIATTGTRFGVPIAKGLGNCLAIDSTARLLLGFGEGRARRMLLLGEMLGTDEAIACGFLLKAVPPEALDGEVAVLVAQVLSNAPLSMKTSKAALGALTANQTAELEEMIRLVYGSDDFRAGVRAFLDKTPPKWTGH
jgi:enoyl-CoA hydratase/carnithine racemase